MAKCIDCAWFPWKPGADVSILPAMRCSPKLAARRWMPTGVTTEHECPEFKAADGEAELKDEQVGPIAAETAEQASQETAPEQEQGEVKVDDTDGGAEDAAQEAVKRANTSRRKR